MTDEDYDRWTDEVAVGTFDEGFIPARLPGRPNIFAARAASPTASGGVVPSPRRRDPWTSEETP